MNFDSPLQLDDAVKEEEHRNIALKSVHGKETVNGFTNEEGKNISTVDEINTAKLDNSLGKKPSTICGKLEDKYPSDEKVFSDLKTRRMIKALNFQQQAKKYVYFLTAVTGVVAVLTLVIVLATTKSKVEGSFSEWTHWNKCSLTCGHGIQTRTRSCTSPAPQYGGQICEGAYSQARICSITGCPVNGGFTTWTDWSSCSVTCGKGSQTRSRTCAGPVPQNGGMDCAGNSTEARSCNIDTCSGPCFAGTSQKSCLSGEMCIDLNDKGTVTGNLDGVTVEVSPTSLQGGKECSRQVKFKVTFDKLPAGSTGLCHQGLYNGRRMLKVQMYFSAKERDGWIFNIGDSPSNDGYAGDYGHTEYEAEIQYLRSTVTVYANNVNRTDCRAQKMYDYSNINITNTNKINVWIANHYIKVATDDGRLCESKCNKCLFGLNGQYTPGSINQDIHVAANRVVNTNHRNGNGLCFLKMSWVSSPEE